MMEVGFAIFGMGFMIFCFVVGLSLGEKVDAWRYWRRQRKAEEERHRREDVT